MSPRTANVFLIGPMGSGKTAVGKHLARLMRAPFRDSDAEVESRTGVDISYIFSREGEAGFRVREREVLEDITRESPIVLATGGGAILLEENRKVLQRARFRGLPAHVAGAAGRARPPGPQPAAAARRRSADQAHRTHAGPGSFI
jgi:shikimate kinase